MTAENENKYVDYLGSSPPTWKRPEGPKRIWKIIDGRKKMANGDFPKFSIEEVTEEMEEDVLDFMVKYFVPEEPICSSMEFTKNELAMREIRTMWRDCLRFGISVVALTVNQDPSVKPAIAGVNILVVKTEKNEKIDEENKQLQFRSSHMRTLMGAVMRLSDAADTMGKYGVKACMEAYGLSVHPSFRGQGLGEEILLTRDIIGRAYEIPVTKTVFTANVSQILAYRCGFAVNVEKKYSEIYDEEGNIAFPRVKAEFMKVMEKRLC